MYNQRHFITVIHALQKCKDWGKDSWLSTDQKSESVDAESRPVRQNVSDLWHEHQDKPETESLSDCWHGQRDKAETENAKTSCGNSLHHLWAHCAGLLILYFTCMPQTKQVYL